MSVTARCLGSASRRCGLVLAAFLVALPAVGVAQQRVPPAGEPLAPATVVESPADVAIAAAPPAFLLERVEVEGLKSAAARAIVLAEARLETGRTYSERELREAVFRVRRLPFVVEADMALGRGSERGAYALVITVDAAKPVAYALDVNGFSSDDDDGFGSGGFDFFAAGTLSARKFVGGEGVLFGSVQGFDYEGAGQILQVGYTRYGFLRPGGFATVAVSSQLGEEFARDDIQASVQLGVPVVGNHALRGGLSWFDEDSREGGLGQGNESLNGELAWVYDSTDDPLVPLAGTRVTTRVTYGETETSFVFPDVEGRPVPGTLESETLWLRSEGRRYWPLGPQQSVGVGLSVWQLETDRRSSVAIPSSDIENLLFLELIHAASLLDFATSRRVGDLRLETSAGVQSFRDRRESVFGEEEQEDTELILRSALTFRHDWGLARLSVAYVSRLSGG